MKKALALIIGNSKYLDDELVTPENDANDLSNKLSHLGFQVKKEINVDIEKFNNLIDSFGNELNSFDIGLFYFAGHGIQIDNNNYLTATNTNFESEIAVKYSAIHLYKVLDYMHKAKNETNIVILDACRDNPFEKKWSRSVKHIGLAPLYAPKGTFISYATSPGEVALNGTGRNGLFTTSLLTHLDEPNIPIEELFKNVRNSVLAFSNGKQTTWEHTSLTGKYIFNSGLNLQSNNSEYSINALEDHKYKLENTRVDEIIGSLKVYDWYTQNPAIESIQNIGGELDKDKLFVLGRNILQTAEGGAWAATGFIENIQSSLRKFTPEYKKHILNGILFEIYFDSYGRFRGSNLKSAFLNEIISLMDNDDFIDSFSFLNEQLMPFKEYLFYTPENKSYLVTIHMVLEKIESNQIVEYKIENIMFNGKDILQKGESHWLIDDEYEPFYFEKFKQKLSHDLGIPKSKLNLNANFEMKDDSKLLFPYGYQFNQQTTPNSR